MSKPSIVIWCNKAANQKALANKIAAKFSVIGIVIDTGSVKSTKKKGPGLVSKIIDRLRFLKIYGAWKRLMRYYDEQFPNWPDVPQLRVAGINQPESFEFTKRLNPDLIVVSGTELVKEPLLSIGAGIGTINLHTGLSPYVKGGPNCTNWCIANGDWHLIGNTIMWLNAGIDAGNIITTETIDIRDSRDLDEVHRRVMDHAHDLYIKAISYLAESDPPYQSIPQSSITKGELYLTKMWTPSKRTALLQNWRGRSRNGNLADVKTVPLDVNRK